MENSTDKKETGTSNNIVESNRPACSACKHQRKKCKKGCPFSLHFPANKHEEFSAVHQIFGISNIAKMMKDMNLEKQGEVVESITWEAMIWTNKDHRESGPLGIYKKLQEDYKKLQEENKQLKEILLKSKQQQFQCQASSPVVVPSDYNSSQMSITVAKNNKNTTTQETFGLGFQGSPQQPSCFIVNRPQQEHNQTKEKGSRPQLPLSTPVQAILPPPSRSSQLETNTNVGRIPSQLTDNLRLNNRFLPYHPPQRFIHGSNFEGQFGFSNQSQQNNFSPGVAFQQNPTVQNNFTDEQEGEVNLKTGTKDKSA